LLAAGAVSFVILVGMALASLRQPNLEAMSVAAIRATLANDPDAYYDLLKDANKEILSREDFRNLWRITVEPRLSQFHASGPIQTNDNEFQALAHVKLTNDKGVELTYSVITDKTDAWAGVEAASILAMAWLAEYRLRNPDIAAEDVDAFEAWLTGLTEDLPKLREAGIRAIPNPETYEPITLDQLAEAWQRLVAESRQQDSANR